MDEAMRIADYAASIESDIYQISRPYNRNAYRDGYPQGYRAGFYDGESGRRYRPQSNYGGSSYNSAFSDGYYKGYEVGYYDARDRRGYNLR
jgi:hypothetical protein